MHMPRAAAHFIAGAVFFLCASGAPVQAEDAALKALDLNNDGTLDLDEAQAAAAAVFISRDADKSGALDARELVGVLDQKTFTAADHDLKGSLDQKEYAAVVEARFKSANLDPDATLDAAELATPEGARLLALLWNPLPFR
jgi:hypothetical protein